ncbi:transglycosylase SLT domain-containing protein [Methylobacterium nigriterrae]|uniref:lytic transglycosylase domain-containing protein n=1 Tax=Methylobacterium nigriterrae TaxID=3127512 RepID=UPI003D66BE4C
MSDGFPDLPLPPAIEALVGLPMIYSRGRSTYLDMITQEAIRQGLPPAVADAVAQVETAYNPNAIGGVGEVGLMQVRPQTAALLGYRGSDAGLAEPAVNVRYGVAYLARAWRLAAGDLCRALMKYRAGHGEERMTPLSAEYCRRARAHLVAIGSPLAGDTAPPAASSHPSVSAAATQPVKPRLLSSSQAAAAEPGRPSQTTKAGRAMAVASVGTSARPMPHRAAQARMVLPPQRSKTVKLASTSIGPGVLTAVESALRLKRQEQTRRIWAERDARLKAIAAKLKRPGLVIAIGI